MHLLKVLIENAKMHKIRHFEYSRLEELRFLASIIKANLINDIEKNAKWQ
jgi:hypothetical protein